MVIRANGTLSLPHLVLDPETEQLGHAFANPIEVRIAHFPDD
jgi:hypothetical protein